MQSNFTKLHYKLSVKESQRKAIKEHKYVTKVNKYIAAQPLAPNGKFI